MKNFFKKALTFGLAGVACLSMTACGNDDSAAKMEAQNREAFNSVYELTSNYVQNLKSLTEESDEEKQFEFKLKLNVNVPSYMDESGDVMAQIDLNFEAGVGARAGTNNDMYAYISTNNFDGDMTQWAQAYLTLDVDDTIYYSCDLLAEPTDWATTYDEYYVLADEPTYIKNTSSHYSEYKVYASYDNETYNLIYEKPTDWDANYANYYIADCFTSNITPVFDATQSYFKISNLAYAYLNADTNQYVKYDLLTNQPADWEYNYSSYFKLDGENYVANDIPDFQENTFYKQVSCLPDMIYSMIAGYDLNGKMALELPIDSILDTFANDNDSTTSEEETSYDFDISEALATLQNITDYDSFKAQITASGASISSTQSDNSSSLIIRQTENGITNTLTITVSSNGSLKVEYKQTAMGYTALTASIELSMTDTFDTTKVPTAEDLAEYEFVSLSDIM